MESDAYFARLLFGVTDWAQISGGVGISDIEKYVDGYRSGNDFAWGVGSKLRFWESGPLELGAAVQLTSLRGGGGTSSGYAKLDAYVIELAVGPSYETHGICVYGGPFVHFIVGDLERRSPSYNTIDVDEEESEFGGYVGMSAEIVKNTSVSLEYHVTNDSYAIGVGIVHIFGAPSRPTTKTRVNSGRPWPKFPKKVVTEPIQKEKLKTDADGKPVKDKDGNFIFVPVE